MLLAYVIYIMLPCLMVLSLLQISSGLVEHKYLYFNRYLLPQIVILLISIIIGYRYGVGSDYFSYEQIYLSQDNSGFVERYGIEYIFYAIYALCYKLGLSYNFSLCILNYIPIWLLYKTFRNDKSFAWIIVMLFLSGQFFLHLNIVRQSIALFVLLYSTRYIINRSFKQFVLFVFIAMGFHTSAILFLPMYYIPRLSFILTTRKLQYSIFFTALLFSSFILTHLIGLMIELMQYTPYGQYGALITDFEITKGSGAGVIVKVIADIVIIYYSVQLSKTYKHSGFDVFYLVYFCGCVISQVFGLTSLLLLRITFLFDSFRFVILGYLFSYLSKKRGVMHVIVFIILLLVYVAYFIGMIYLHNNHCSPYKFVI